MKKEKGIALLEHFLFPEMHLPNYIQMLKAICALDFTHGDKREHTLRVQRQECTEAGAKGATPLFNWFLLQSCAARHIVPQTHLLRTSVSAPYDRSQ